MSPWNGETTAWKALGWLLGWTLVGGLVIAISTPRFRTGVTALAFLQLYLVPVYSYVVYRLRLRGLRKQSGATDDASVEIRARLSAARSAARGLVVFLLAATLWLATFPLFEREFVHSADGVALWLGVALLMLVPPGLGLVLLLLWQAYLLERLVTTLAPARPPTT